MHRVAEEGIAAHWRYKEGRPIDARGDDKDKKRFAWLRQLMEWQRDLKDPTEFIETVKIDLFADEVYVFTPKGDVKALPKGAIPIDFAYAIHTEVGHHCSGARVNGLIVPLRYVLRNGDTVEIITSPNQKPNKDWLKFVITSSAQGEDPQLHAHRAAREVASALGTRAARARAAQVRLHAQQGAEVGRARRARRRSSSCSRVDELFIAVGYGKVLPADVIEQVVPEDKRKIAARAGAARPRRDRCKPAPARSRGGTTVGHQGRRRGRRAGALRQVLLAAAGRSDRRLHHARARRHRAHAATATRRSIRIPSAASRSSGTASCKTPRPVVDPGACAPTSRACSRTSRSRSTISGVNISQANCRSIDDNKAVNTFTFAVQDLDQLKTVMRALQKISGVFQSRACSGGRRAHGVQRSEREPVAGGEAERRCRRRARRRARRAGARLAHEATRQVLVGRRNRRALGVGRQLGGLEQRGAQGLGVVEAIVGRLLPGSGCTMSTSTAAPAPWP